MRCVIYQKKLSCGFSRVTYKVTHLNISSRKKATFEATNTQFSGIPGGIGRKVMSPGKKPSPLRNSSSPHLTIPSVQ